MVNNSVSFLDVGLWLFIGLGAWAVYQKLSPKRAYDAQVMYTPPAAPTMPTWPSPPIYNNPNVPQLPAPPTYPWTQQQFVAWLQQVIAIARTHPPMPPVSVPGGQGAPGIPATQFPIAPYLQNLPGAMPGYVRFR